MAKTLRRQQPNVEVTKHTIIGGEVVQTNTNRKPFAMTNKVVLYTESEEGEKKSWELTTSDGYALSAVEKDHPHPKKEEPTAKKDS